jgi:hypothetical protein
MPRPTCRPERERHRPTGASPQDVPGDCRDPSCGEPLRGSQRDRPAPPVAAEASPGPRYCLTIPTLPVKVTVPQPGKSAEVLVSDTLFRTVTLAV